MSYLVRQKNKYFGIDKLDWVLIFVIFFWYFTASFWATFYQKVAKPLWSGVSDIYLKVEIVGVGIWK